MSQSFHTCSAFLVLPILLVLLHSSFLIFFFVFLSLDLFLPYVRAHSSDISP